MEFDELCSLSADELERRKIAHEIISQKMQWWKKPAWLAAMIPAAIAAISLGVTAYTNLSDAQIRVKEYEQRLSNLNEDAKIAERELRLRRLEAEEAEQKEKEAAKLLIDIKNEVKVTEKERDDFQRENAALQARENNLLEEQEKFHEAGVRYKAEIARLVRLNEQVLNKLEDIRKERNVLSVERTQLAKDLEEIARRDAENIEAERAAQAAREEARKAEEQRLAAEIKLQQESTQSESTFRPPVLTFCQGRPNCIEP